MFYAILGETASGKTDLALKLCSKLSLPLVCFDAFQVYKEMAIGTAKPTEEELDGIETHFVSNVSITEEFSIARFQKEARKVLDNLVKEGKDAILTGGSFLYLKSTLYDYRFSEEKGASDFDSLPLDELVLKLKEADINAYNSVDLNNKRRVVRALEMALQGDSRSSEEHSYGNKLIYPVKFFQIENEVSSLDQRINARVDKMFEMGLFDEVKNLLENYPHTLNAFKAIGYKEFISADNLSDLVSISNQIKLDTRRYAKRQRTFLRHQFENIHVMKKEDILSSVIYDVLRRKRNRGSMPSTSFQNKRVGIVGLGGVGSIVATSLARLGVYKLNLVDFDKVDETNLNRQLAYDMTSLNRYKTDVCLEKIALIDPLVEAKTYNQKFSVSHIEDCDFIFDCIDDVEAKTELIKYCLDNSRGFVVSTSSGLRYDASQFRLGYLVSANDPLSNALKRRLTEKYSYTESEFKKIPCVYAVSQPLKRKSEYIPSNVIGPNAEGLCMLSAFIKAN